jgi:hypothetical protein
MKLLEEEETNYMTRQIKICFTETWAIMQRKDKSTHITNNKRYMEWRTGICSLQF